MNKIKYIFSVFVTLTALILVYLITYNFVEPKAYDFMVKNVLTERLPFDKHKQIYGSGDIVLVVIDDKTVGKYRWPWKRDINCKIFDYFLKYSNPAIFVHDSIITTLDKDNPQADKKFFNSIKKYNNRIVEGFLLTPKFPENPQRSSIYDKKFEEKFGVQIEGKISSTSPFQSHRPFPKEYFDVVKNVGSVVISSGFIDGNINYNVDEVCRTYQYIVKYKDKIYPSLALKTFSLLFKEPKIEISNKMIKFADLKYEIKQKTAKFQSVVPIRYYKLYNGFSHPVVSASDIIDSYDSIIKGQKPKYNPADFSNKIIVFGAYSPASTSLNDSKNSPVTPNHPGVDIQATAIDNIIHNDFLKVLPNFFNIILTVLGMLLVYTIIRVSDLFKSILYTFILVITYFLFCSICFYFEIVVNVITPVVMFIITMILAYIHKFVLENRSKEKVKNAMGKYMSQDVMKRVVMNIDNLGLGGKKATVTVLFSDIRGFTSMSENMSAQDVSEILNEYFTEMEPIITKYNGIINKFIGDAVMAIFGEPIQDKNHATNAVRCGYEMILKVKELQKKWVAEGKPKIDIGIGINTGEVFVGNIGSVNRMEYTVIGDTVNLASRLESYNKIYKTKMLISKSTYEETKNIVDTIKISNVEIRGKANKMDIYEVLKVIE